MEGYMETMSNEMNFNLFSSGRSLNHLITPSEFFHWLYFVLFLTASIIFESIFLEIIWTSGLVGLINLIFCLCHSELDGGEVTLTLWVLLAEMLIHKSYVILVTSPATFFRTFVTFIKAFDNLCYFYQSFLEPHRTF